MNYYFINFGVLYFRGLYAAVPGLRKCLLGFRAKRFGEQYHHLQQRRRACSKGSLRDSSDSLSSVTNLNGQNESDNDDDCKFYIKKKTIFLLNLKKLSRFVNAKN